MAIMVLDPDTERQLLNNRSCCDGSQYEEVWDGVYVIMPLSVF